MKTAATLRPYVPGVPTALHRDTMRNVWSPKSDTIFGENLRVIPMRKVANAQPQPDTRRDPFDVAGIFRAPREPVQVSQSDAGKGLQVALDKPTFSIALAACPYAIQRGDVIVRLDRGAYYEVHAMRADNLQLRGLFEVVEMGVQQGLGDNPFD